MTGRAAARALGRWARQLGQAATVSAPAALPPALAAAALAGGGTAVWAAAADPATPFPGPLPQPEAPAASNEGTAQWRVFTDIARDLVREGRREEAERYLRRALEAAERGFGASDPHVASACQNLAELYRLEKQYDRAGPLYDRALGILGASYGPRDIRLAFALHNVAGYYYAQRDWDRAAQYYEQALTVKLAAVGPGHTETSNTQFHLAEVRWAQGRREEAIALARASLGALEAQAASDAACARRRCRLGDMLVEAGRAGEAEPLLRRAMDEAAVEGAGWAPAAEALARALRQLRRRAEAAALLEEAVARRRGSGGGEASPATAAALRQLAEARLEALTSGGGGRPAEVAGRQLAALEAARQAVETAEAAHRASLEAADARKALRERAAGGGNGEGWVKGLISRWQGPDLPKVLKAARLEVTVLELASCLVTLAQVERALGAAAGEEGRGGAAAALLRAQRLLSEEWPGAPEAARIEELRRQGLCQVLRERLAAVQGAGDETAAVERELNRQGCAAEAQQSQSQSQLQSQGAKKRVWKK